MPMAVQTALSIAGEDGLSGREDRMIGALFVATGRLSREDVANILRAQDQRRLRFGEAAVELGLLTSSEIESALAHQFNSPLLVPGESKISEALIAAYASSGAEVEALRALRGQLLLRWFHDSDHNALALVSGERREGRSFVAANLAVMFSRLGKRTLLIDADLRNPSQHLVFGIENRVGLSAVLSGRGGPETIQPIPGLPDLSVLPAGALPPNSVELLAQPLFVELLNELRREFDVILLDSPAATECADAQTIAMRAGAALIVVRKDVTRMWKMRGVSDTVVQTSATVLGTVLNDY